MGPFWEFSAVEIASLHSSRWLSYIAAGTKEYLKKYNSVGQGPPWMINSCVAVYKNLCRL
jgi:hypothetical protein